MPDKVPKHITCSREGFERKPRFSGFPQCCFTEIHSSAQLTVAMGNSKSLEQVLHSPMLCGPGQNWGEKAAWGRKGLISLQKLTGEPRSTREMSSPI